MSKLGCLKFTFCAKNFIRRLFLEMAIRMGFPIGIHDKIGNGDGKKWETTCRPMGMGMAFISMEM